MIGDGTSWFSLCSHKPEAGDSSHASPSCYMALAKAHPVSGLRTLILEKRREGGLGQRESLCYGHTHTQAPPSSSTLRDGQTLTPHHTHTHITWTQTHAHTHIIQTHTPQATWWPPPAPSSLPPSPPLCKLPVPSSVPRNHLPNIRILKNMARF